MNQVKAIQGDTFDSIAYRYFAEQSTVMLPVLLEANPNIQSVILEDNQAINLPEKINIHTTQPLKLWD